MIDFHVHLRDWNQKQTFQPYDYILENAPELLK